jgi:signal transduction histidine kinase
MLTMDISSLSIVALTSSLAGIVLGILLSTVIFRRIDRSHFEADLRARKDQFISLSSHYLLNPITIIQTAISSLKERDSALTADQRLPLYDAIERGQQRLWIITQQLILVGEIDQDDLQVHLAVANIYDTVTSAISSVDSFAREKGISIKLEDSSHDVREARFDARRMKQALIAVLDNAVKFSLEKGEVVVRVGWESNIFTVEVEDFGIGMPEGIVEHISEKFFRGSDTYTFDYEGIGLGLHIAQAIVRMHQGNISIQSKPKQGTLVSVQFPSL